MASSRTQSGPSTATILYGILCLIAILIQPSLGETSVTSQVGALSTIGTVAGDGHSRSLDELSYHNPWDYSNKIRSNFEEEEDQQHEQQQQQQSQSQDRQLQQSVTVACPTGLPRLPTGVMRTQTGCQCAAGFIQSGAGNNLQCTPCPAGFFSSSPGFVGPFCRRCPSNSGSNGLTAGTRQCTCFPGYRTLMQMGNTLVCDQCPAGFYASTGDRVCTPCPPGADSLAGSGSCFCKSRYSQSGTGPTLQCNLCPFNTYWVANTCKSPQYGYTTAVRGTSRGPFLQIEANSIQGACYAYINQPNSWSNAVFACDRMSNGWLVTINSRGENNYISSISLRNPTWIGTHKFETCI